MCVRALGVEGAGEVGIEVECGERRLMTRVEVGTGGKGDGMRMGVGNRSGAEKLVLTVEVEKGGLCDSDACRRAVAIFGCAFGTSQLPLFGRVREADGDPASGVVPSPDHPPVKTLDDLLGTGSRLEPDKCDDSRWITQPCLEKPAAADSMRRNQRR